MSKGFKRYNDRLCRDTMRVTPPEYNGQPVSWAEIARWISEEDGVPISGERVRALTDRLLSYILGQLLDDPEIRCWAEEQGIDISSGDVLKIRRGHYGHSNFRHRNKRD